MTFHRYIILCLIITLTLSKLSQEQNVNYLEDIHIGFKREDSFYHQTIYDDSNIYYFKSEPDVRSEPNMCTIVEPTMLIEPASILSRDCGYLYYSKNHIGCLTSNELKILTTTSIENRVGFELSSIITLPKLKKGVTINNQMVQFNRIGSTLMVYQDQMIHIYFLNEIKIQYLVSIKQIDDLNFENDKLSFLKPNTIFQYNPNSKIVKSYQIQQDQTAKKIKDYENVKDFQADEFNAYIIKENNEIIFKSNKQESNFIPQSNSVEKVINYQSNELLLYSIATKTNNSSQPFSLNENGQKFGKLTRIQIEDSGQTKETVLLSVSDGVKNIIVTQNNLILMYSSYLRVYKKYSADPTFRQLKSNIQFFDFVETSKFDFHSTDFMSFQEIDFLFPKHKGQEYHFLKVDVKKAYLECKKQQSENLAETTFQARILTTSCQDDKVNIQKFNNGSCAFIQSVQLSTNNENVLLKYFIGFGVGVFFGVLIVKLIPKCTQGQSSLEDEYVSKNKRLKMNAGLSSSYNNKNQETRKFIYGNDDTVPSEEFRDLSPTGNNKQASFTRQSSGGGGGISNKFSSGGKGAYKNKFNHQQFQQQQQQQQQIYQQYQDEINNQMQHSNDHDDASQHQTGNVNQSGQSNGGSQTTFETPRFNFGLGLNHHQQNSNPPTPKNPKLEISGDDSEANPQATSNSNTQQIDFAIEEMPSAEDRTTKRNDDSFGEV